VLLGAPIHEVFPEVPDADFREAILADLEWIRHHSTQIYGVLNACRVLAYLSGEGVLPKAEAVDWALRNLRQPTGRRSQRLFRRIGRAPTGRAHRMRCKGLSDGAAARTELSSGLPVSSGARKNATAY
jgi:hypothetical protein